MFWSQCTLKSGCIPRRQLAIMSSSPGTRVQPPACAVPQWQEPRSQDAKDRLTPAPTTNKSKRTLSSFFSIYPHRHSQPNAAGRPAAKHLTTTMPPRRRTGRLTLRPYSTPTPTP